MGGSLIDNPNYFELSNPLKDAVIEAIGMEIWTMDADIFIDNVLLTSDEAIAKDLAKHTFHVKQKKELKSKQANEKKAAEEMKKGGKGKGGIFFNEIVEIITDNPIVAGVTAVALMLSTFIIIKRRKQKPSEDGELQTDAEESTWEQSEAEVQPKEKEEVIEEQAEEEEEAVVEEEAEVEEIEEKEVEEPPVDAQEEVQTEEQVDEQQFKPVSGRRRKQKQIAEH
ncbi:hypothetical protein GEMRC1_009344 [Eukaryota sp. GEM-RC1]